MQGAPVVTQDFDLWFEDLNDPNLRRALRDVGAAYVPPFGLNPPMLAGGNSEPFDVVISMSGLGRFGDEVRHAREMRLGRIRLKVLSLERILVSKIAANRPKDQLVIPVLRDALRVSEERENRTKRSPKKTKRTRKK